ncbi:hypothetical protein AMATHDRAFT_50258 [Amanita thiersii Skay4041]|uniref:Uncharacterized protein n=1 Tax=Amanita thiersii Skay4041 TaxID=703135 RepID=A0A2A9N9A5_9AGAR|nr:hypothetical protein AMATHDRAFT_50258 [Amanita thiersii Skay4041]
MPTCFITAASRKIVIAWLALTVIDTFQCALLGYRAYREFSFGGRSRLVTLIYKDGIIYYIFMMGMSVVCMTLFLTLPPEYLRLTTGPTHVIHTALTARVVLHVRRLAAKQCSNPSWISVESTDRTMLFASAQQLSQ